jgi:hypothetical protein
MVTLMYMLKLLFLAIVFVVGAALEVNAQTQAVKSSASMPPQGQASQPSGSGTLVEGRGIFFNINMAGQSREQTFNEGATFSLYNETGAVGTSHAIGGGPVLDLSAGIRVWRSLSVGIGYSSFKDDDDAGVTARVPHPILFQQPRTESTTVSGLEHTENVVHLHFMWTIPYRDRFKLALMLGPSFFTVRQDLATVRANDIADPPPLIESVTVTNVKESTTGFHIGADGSYHVTRIQNIGIGVGLFARYVGASVSLPNAAGATLDGDLKGGGFQGGGGLRLTF